MWATLPKESTIRTYITARLWKTRINKTVVMNQIIMVPSSVYFVTLVSVNKFKHLTSKQQHLKCFCPNSFERQKKIHLD